MDTNIFPQGVLGFKVVGLGGEGRREKKPVKEAEKVRQESRR